MVYINGVLLHVSLHVTCVVQALHTLVLRCVCVCCQRRLICRACVYIQTYVHVCEHHNAVSMCCVHHTPPLLQPNFPDDYLGPFITGPDGQELKGCVLVRVLTVLRGGVFCWWGYLLAVEARSAVI